MKENSKSIGTKSIEIGKDKNELFVGLEKLLIVKNKNEKTITDSNTNITQIEKTYFPFVFFNYVERDFYTLFLEENGIEKQNKMMATLKIK